MFAVIAYIEIIATPGQYVFTMVITVAGSNVVVDPVMKAVLVANKPGRIV